MSHILRLHAARIALLVLIIAGLLATTVFTNVPTAVAVDRRMVCAQSLWVRDAPAGHPIAILYYGEHFDIYERRDSWSKGFAWGGENVVGWVLHQYLSDQYGRC